MQQLDRPVIVAGERRADHRRQGPGVAGTAVQRLLLAVHRVVLDGVRHVEGNMVPVCLCTALMFPAYWFVWKFLFPQPYENLWLRLAGSALCLLIAAKNVWPRTMRRFLPSIWLGAVLYCGPFYFTFMLLQNDNSIVWLMSTLVALFLLVLLVDWISLVLLFVVGSVLAWCVHSLMVPGFAAATVYVEFIPIFVLPLIAGSIFSYKAAGLRETRDKAYLEVGALAAREMRSPLVSIRTHAASLGKLLPPLVRGYVEGASQPQHGPALPETQLRALERVPAGIDDAVQEINGFIQVLLAQAGQEATDQEDHRSLPISRCIDDAIARLPLRPELDHARIVFHRERDFRIAGSLVLMTHVLARVLEASFDAIYTDAGAKLVIVLGSSGGWNYIRIEDSSAGPQSTGAIRLSRLFSRTDMDFSDRHDLAIASLVMQRIGGFVTRSLEFGRTTQLTLWFPLPGSLEVR